MWLIECLISKEKKARHTSLSLSCGLGTNKNFFWKLDVWKKDREGLFSKELHLPTFPWTKRRDIYKSAFSSTKIERKHLQQFYHLILHQFDLDWTSTTINENIFDNFFCQLWRSGERQFLREKTQIWQEDLSGVKIYLRREEAQRRLQ